MHQVQQSLRIVLKEVSHCCNKPMFVGRYSTGGFVKSCCDGCGSQNTIDASQFERAVSGLKIPCRVCGKSVQPTTDVDRYRSYGFRCECDAWTLLSDLVPDLPR